MKSSKAYYLVQPGTPADTAIRNWVERFRLAEIAKRELMDSLGADRAFSFGLEAPSGFGFPSNAVPEGWLKPGRNGYTRPRQSNKEDLKRINDLPYPETLYEMVARDLKLAYGSQLSRGEGDIWMSGALGQSIRPFDLAWTSDGGSAPADLFLIAPDYAGHLAEMASLREREPELVITYTPEGTGTDLPEGLVRITQAEMELAFAQAAVRREKAEAVEPGM